MLLQPNYEVPKGLQDIYCASIFSEQLPVFNHCIVNHYTLKILIQSRFPKLKSNCIGKLWFVIEQKPFIQLQLVYFKPKVKMLFYFRKLLSATVRRGAAGKFYWIGSDSWGAKIHPVRDQEWAAEGAITILPKRNNIEGESRVNLLILEQIQILN